MFIIFSVLSAYSQLQISYDRNTRLQYSTWWERAELSHHSKYIIDQLKRSHRCSITKAVLKNSTILTGKYLNWSFFLIKIFKADLLKRNSNTGVFLWILQNFLRSSANGCFYQRLFRHNQSKAIRILHKLFF